MSQEETVKMSVSIQLPRNVHDVLERFAAFVGVPLEQILKEDLEASIPTYYQSDTFDEWFRKALRSHGAAKYFQVQETFKVSEK